MFAVGCVLAADLGGTAASWAQTTQTTQSTPTPAPTPVERSLRVGVKPIEPFVFAPEQGNPAGYSIDLWTAIAPQINAQTQYVVYDTTPELLDALRRGEATGLDFSHPIYEAGLQLLVLQSQKSQVNCPALKRDGVSQPTPSLDWSFRRFFAPSCFMLPQGVELSGSTSNEARSKPRAQRSFI
ncbi:transporter substrate-binding domain-containing protein [Thermoleptolyngbya sp.]